MKKETYQIENSNIYEYRFVSSGKRTITKIVQFTPLKTPGYFNLGFGDLKDDGSVDDLAETNNDDLIKVIATIGFIISDFFKNNKGAVIFFSGSTVQRTNVYQIILKRNYEQLCKKYILSALIADKSGGHEISYEPNNNGPFLGFFMRIKD